MSFPTRIPTFDRLGARSGLSIVEVLTSIVVAMIGVFGVMVLIPFAVRQAQTGLDSDAAVTAARNAVSQMELTGMQFPQNWQTESGPYDSVVPTIFSLDPLGVTETSFGDAGFPFRGGNLGGLAIEAANFRDPSGVAFNSELARRMCRTADDLLFEEPDISLLNTGPPQIFDVDGSGTALRRQANGRVSWSAVVVPFKSSSASAATSTSRWSYRMYILVYKNRRFDDALRVGGPGSELARDPDGTITDLGGVMVAEQVGAANTGVQSPLGNVVDVPETVTEVMQRDDWVLLINRDSGKEPGFDRQLAFCRVVNLAGTSVTLDGPDFDFGAAGTETYIAHLNGVVGVYERTFTPEQESNWNLSN